MKRITGFGLLALFLSGSVFGQGSLMPPGAPAPTMKTLDQIESRTIITHLPYSITNSGSYVVTANLVGAAGVDGITVSAGDVTLDLNGFTLSGGTSNSLSGILLVGALENVVIRNGGLRDWGASAVDALDAVSGRLLDVHAQNNHGGVYVGDHWVVRNCSSADNNGAGIFGKIECRIMDCTVSGNQDTGIRVLHGSVLSGCSASHNRDGFEQDFVGEPDRLGGVSVSQCTASYNVFGFNLGPHSSLRGCTASSNQVHGVLMAYGSTVSECTADFNGDYGFSLGGRSSITACSASKNTKDGFDIYGGTVISECSAFSNGEMGIDAADAAVVINCTASDNGSIGILAGNNGTIRGCSASGSNESGIDAGPGSLVSDCTVQSNDFSGIHVKQDGRVSGSVATGNGGFGISTGPGSSVAGCTANANGSSGIYVGTGSMVKDCTVRVNGKDGILITSNTQALNNTCDGNGTAGSGAGIRQTVTGTTRTRIEGNTLTGNDYGLYVAGNRNMVVKNSANQNTVNYYFAPGSQTKGPDYTSGVPDPANPWANFEF